MYDIAKVSNLSYAIEVLAITWDLFRNEPNPFENSGSEFHGSHIDVWAYDWSEQRSENLRWRDVSVEWYKYYSRGLWVSRKVSDEEVREFLREGLADIINA